MTYKSAVCAICGKAFVPHYTRNRFGPQVTCGKLECQRKRHYWRIRQKIDYYRAKWREYNMARTTKKVKVEGDHRKVRSPFLPCSNCNFYLLPADLACPRCGQPKDLKKAVKARKRLKKSYYDIVRDNAIKEGKDPKAEIRRIRRIRQWLW